MLEAKQYSSYVVKHIFTILRNFPQHNHCFYSHHVISSEESHNVAFACIFHFLKFIYDHLVIAESTFVSRTAFGMLCLALMRGHCRPPASSVAPRFSPWRYRTYPVVSRTILWVVTH